MILLAAYAPDALLPHSDGLAAGRLRALIESTNLRGERHDSIRANTNEHGGEDD